MGDTLGSECHLSPITIILCKAIAEIDLLWYMKMYENVLVYEIVTWWVMCWATQGVWLWCAIVGNPVYSGWWWLPNTDHVAGAMLQAIWTVDHTYYIQVQGGAWQ